MAERQGLHNLVSSPGARRKRKRLGRGESSGLGKTSGKGHKGQKARKSGGVRPGFEGGQLPLARRLPKRGFKNAPFRKKWQVLNLEMLEMRGLSGDVKIVDLLASGLIKKVDVPVKILGRGDVSSVLNVEVHACSESAKKKIEDAGGVVTFIV